MRLLIHFNSRVHTDVAYIDAGAVIVETDDCSGSNGLVHEDGQFFILCQILKQTGNRGFSISREYCDVKLKTVILKI